MTIPTPTTEEVLRFTARVDNCPHCDGKDEYLIPFNKSVLTGIEQWVGDKYPEQHLKVSSIHDRTCRRFRIEVPMDVIDMEKFNVATRY